jgi:hypothetical protein
MSPLERRYRRLLIAYPRAYRNAYGDEMVGVLMDSAGPDQHHPSASDALHLLRHGLLSRARRLPTLPGRALRFDSPQWTNAAALFAVVGALLLAAKNAYLLARVVGLMAYLPGYRVVGFPTDHLVAACLWVATAAALVLRLRRIGAALAVIAALGEVVIAATAVLDINAATVMRLTAAVAVALAALLGRRTPMPRNWSLLGFVLAAGLLASTGARVEAQVSPAFTSLFQTRESFYAALAVLLTLAWVVLTQPAPVRRRLLVFLAAPVAQLCALALYDSGSSETYSLLPPALGAALICAAVLGPGLVLLAVRRTERLSHLVALGREAEARQTTAVEE